jgi:hypothetical protein
LELFALFAEHFHVEVAVGLDPVLVDLDGESANEPQRALLVGEDANDMGAALDLLIDPLEHVCAFEMLVMLSGQPVKSEGFLDVFFHPRAKFGVFFLPAQQPGGQISAGFLGVTPIVEPSQFDQAVIGNLARQIVERVAQKMHIVRQPPGQ